MYPLREEQVRAVIIAQGRSGSTVFEDILCSSGHFTGHGELLRKKVLFPQKFVVGFANACEGNFICHVKMVGHQSHQKNPSPVLDIIGNKSF